MPRIEIYGAAYGGSDVTDKVKAIVDAGATTIQAENSVFGDPWYGTVKSLSVTYRIVNIVSCKEHESLSLPNGAKILGAAYGLADVTHKVRALYDSNNRTIQAENGVFGDSWVGTVKSFSVTYAIEQTRVAQEHNSLSLL